MTGFGVYEERNPGNYYRFYWAAERQEAVAHAVIIRSLFPDRRIIVAPKDPECYGDCHITLERIFGTQRAYRILDRLEDICE